MRLTLALVFLFLALNLSVPTLSAEANHYANNVISYPTISFSIGNATSDTYREFIKELRAQLTTTTGGTTLYDIPLLNPVVPDSRRFVLIELISSFPGINTTLAIDVVNVSIVAFRCGDKSYFLQDAPDAATNLFNETGIERVFLNFSASSYADLERVSGADRVNTTLGLSALDTSVVLLSRDDHVDDYSKFASALLQITQMVSDAARFRFIEQRVRNSIRHNLSFVPDMGMVSLEDNWAALSLEIQRSYNGLFNRTIELKNFVDSPIYVDNVMSTYIVSLAFMFNQCYSTSTFNNIIRMPVNIDEKCTVFGSTRSLSGWNGSCVGVRGEDPGDEEQIQLHACNPRQYWTFGTDGTIRLSSDGKCMTAYGHSAGQYIEIEDCQTAEEEGKATQWSLTTDGTITDPQSGLVLSGTALNTYLTLEVDIKATTQAWRASNDTEPMFTLSIYGYNDLCLEADDEHSHVWLVAECGSFSSAQALALYSDGTIRLELDSSLCLTSDDSDLVIISKCEVGLTTQRWVFKTDGAILNPHSGLVWDVEDSNVSQIILSSATGNPNQQWVPFF